MMELVSRAGSQEHRARLASGMRRVWAERKQGLRPLPARVAKPKAPLRGRSSAWTPERRAKQAIAIMRWRPWSSGAGVKPGHKTRSRYNALKHGLRSAAVQEITTIRREIREFVRKGTK